MNLAIFRKHVSQKLLVKSGSNVVDTLLKVGASDIMLMLMTRSFPFQGFDGKEFSMWLDRLVYVIDPSKIKAGAEINEKAGELSTVSGARPVVFSINTRP